MTTIDLLEHRLDEITHPLSGIPPEKVAGIQRMLVARIEEVCLLQDLLDSHRHLGYYSASLGGEACPVLSIHVHPDHADSWVKTLRGVGYAFIGYLLGRERVSLRLVAGRHQVLISHELAAEDGCDYTPLTRYFEPAPARRAACA